MEIIATRRRASLRAWAEFLFNAVHTGRGVFIMKSESDDGTERLFLEGTVELETICEVLAQLASVSCRPYQWVCSSRGFFGALHKSAICEMFQSSLFPRDVSR